MKPQRLLLDGKPVQRRRAPRIRKLIDICDKLPFGTAISTKELVRRMDLASDTCPDSGGRIHPDDRAEAARRKFRVSYQILAWAHPTTIEALKNGKLKA